MHVVCFFITCIEMLPRVARDVAEGKVLDGGIVLPAMKAFMKNVTTLIETKSCIEHLLQRQTQFSVCAGPRGVAASLTIHGDVVEIISPLVVSRYPAVKEQPVKSLGRCYSIPLNDRHRSTEIDKNCKARIDSYRDTGLIEKLKAWIF